MVRHRNRGTVTLVTDAAAAGDTWCGLLLGKRSAPGALVALSSIL